MGHNGSWLIDFLCMQSTVILHRISTAKKLSALENEGVHAVLFLLKFGLPKLIQSRKWQVLTKIIKISLLIIKIEYNRNT